MKESFEEFYYKRLSKVDASIFDKDYFKDTSTDLLETYERERIARRTAQVTLVLLILCIFGILDKFVFNGISFDLQKYSPLILLVYSATNLTLSILKTRIATREAILTAHSRLVASDEDADLYRLRFPINFTPPIRSILDIDKTTAVAPRPPGYSIKTVTLVAIVFILGYVLLYGYLAGYALFVPGTPLIIRIAVVLSAFTLELVSASVSFALEFGRRRNPEMIREYLAKVTQILSTNKANS